MYLTKILRALPRLWSNSTLPLNPVLVRRPIVAVQRMPRYLACAETWASNERRDPVPGLTTGVHSMSSAPDHAGGDVHYVSVCPSCVVSRIALAEKTVSTLRQIRCTKELFAEQCKSFLQSISCP